MEEILVTGPRLPKEAPIKGYQQAGANPKFDDVIYEYPDGTIETRTGGSLAWRANNPGNLGYGDFATSKGALGGFRNPGAHTAIFPDSDTGRSAMDALLHTKTYPPSLTIDQTIRTYAGKYNADVPSYQKFVQNKLGLPGTTLRSDLTPEQWNTMRQSMRLFENTTPGTIAVKRPR